MPAGARPRGGDRPPPDALRGGGPPLDGRAAPRVEPLAGEQLRDTGHVRPPTLFGRKPTPGGPDATVVDATWAASRITPGPQVAHLPGRDLEEPSPGRRARGQEGR